MARCVQHRLPILHRRWRGGCHLHKLRHRKAHMGLATLPWASHSPSNLYDNWRIPNPRHSQQLGGTRQDRPSEASPAQSEGSHNRCGTRIGRGDVRTSPRVTKSGSKISQFLLIIILSVSIYPSI